MKTRKDIISLPNPHLRQKSSKISKFDKSLQQLIIDMESATLDWEDHRDYELGVALAAVQIDQLKRVVVIRNNFENKDDRTFSVLINPEIIKAEGDIIHEHEGCLSVPDIYGLVPRYNKVRVKALDINGDPIRLKAEGFLARVLQHEIDHTNGIVFIDHIKDQDAFFKLDKQGNIVSTPHDEILQNSILW